MKKIKLFFSALAFIICATAFAQNITVSGVVFDETTGEAIPSATVLVKGSTTAYTMTDNLGGFSISAPSKGTLVVSCLGYMTVEKDIDGAKTLEIKLATDKNLLEDAVVVAYGTVSREANMGSVATVKNDEIAMAPATTVDKMLSGKLAGVSVTSGSGQPGSGSKIRIRGTSSINAGSEPLWVIDGIPVYSYDMRGFSNVGAGGGSSTTFLNPNDIETITVLKDAAAASVYGSRAANGVILVTTKSGKSGRARFTARAKYGVQQLVNDNNLRPLTGQELLDYRRVAAINAGYDPYNPSSKYYYPDTLLEDGTTNWYKELTRIGSVQEYEINATGGTDKASYYSSIAYHKNTGVFYGVDYQRLTARVNADMKLTNTLKTGARINFSYADSNSGQMGGLYYSNPQFAMLRILPWTPFRNPDGTFNDMISENANTNPRACAEYDTYNDQDYRLQGSIYLEWKPIKQLTFKTTNGIEFMYVAGRQYWAPETNEGSTRLFTSRYNDVRFTTSNTVTFEDKYGDHAVRVLAGHELMFDNYDAVEIDSPEVNPLIPYISTSTGAKDQAYYSLVQETMLSFFGIADYNYNNKYSAQASVRGDGSSLFGANNRWGLFWSVGASWNITNEDWMDATSLWLSNLKIRASYGVNGNNNISAYRAYGTYASVAYANYNGMLPSTPANPDLSWEKNKTWNVGLDFGFFDDRLTGSLDVYDRRTEDMLLSKKVPYTTGFGSNFMNIGALKNNGVEFQLEGVLVRRNDWLWTAGFNVAFNKSKVIDLGGNEFLTASDDSPARIVEGKSLLTYYLRDWYGVNPSTGEGLFYDNDGKLTSSVSKARYIYKGSPEPKAQGGFNTSISWKGLSLSAYFDYSIGAQVVVNNQNIDDAADMTTNITNLALNYWKKPGDTGVTPKPVAGAPGRYYVGYSTRFLQDASFLRIKDVTLSYNLSDKALKAIKMKGLKFYVSALNAFTFHDVDAFDPEVNTVGYVGAGSHPLVKTFVGGIEVTF